MSNATPSHVTVTLLSYMSREAQHTTSQEGTADNVDCRTSSLFEIRR